MRVFSPCDTALKASCEMFRCELIAHRRHADPARVIRIINEHISSITLKPVMPNKKNVGWSCLYYPSRSDFACLPLASGSFDPAPYGRRNKAVPGKTARHDTRHYPANSFRPTCADACDSEPFFTSGDSPTLKLCAYSGLLPILT